VSAATDRAAAVRAALRRLVAERGLHGASMAAVAAEAGVATGTAYVHYASKDDLLLAAYLELKADLGAAAVAALDPDAGPADRFAALWRGVHAFLAVEPERARFLLQVEASPMAAAAHERVMAAGDDPILAEAARADLAACLLPLPLEVLWDLGFGPAIRLAAADDPVSAADLALVITACWRAVTRP